MERIGRSPRLSTVLTVMVSLALLAGCGGSDDAAESKTKSTSSEKASTTSTPDEEEGRGDPIPDEPEPTSGPTDEFTNITDPVNGAFTVDVPVGWDNLVYSVVDGTFSRQVVNSVSPDGQTVLFAGDPRLPRYWIPSMADEITRMMADALDSLDLADYTPAPQFLQNYISEKFGSLTGFEIERSEGMPEVEQKFRDASASAGLPSPNVDAARVHFAFTDDEGRPNSAYIAATTFQSGSAWDVLITGLATTGSATDYDPMVVRMFNSIQMTPEFTASQNARHQQTMAQIQANTDAMTRRHEANMAAIQSSAQAHQQRMQSIWSANDASMSNYYQRMSSGDVQHRQFLNVINEESTVQTSSGTKMQVDNSYDRYWVNKSDNSYVGGDINFGQSQISGMGLNPNDYEEVQVVKG